MSGTRVPARRSGRPQHGEPILERAFRVLGAFAQAGEGLPLHTLATRAGLPKSTTSRIAAQLIGVGALERLDNGDFIVGLQLLEIASLAPRGHGLRAAALPFMEDLHRVTGQHILLAVRDGHEAVLVERLSARDAAAVKYRVGGRLPLTETGIGIALLAHVVTLGVAVANGSAWVADVAVGGRRQPGRYSSNQGSPSGLRAWPTCCRRWIL
jgi:hypothetical protein